MLKMKLYQELNRRFEKIKAANLNYHQKREKLAIIIDMIVFAIDAGGLKHNEYLMIKQLESEVKNELMKG